MVEGANVYRALERGAAAVAAVPGYERSRVSTGVVHVGVGGFHRAHRALYLDRLTETSGELGSGSAASACCPEIGR